MDVMISEEAYYSVIDGRYNGDPGGVYRRCAPTSVAGFRASPWGKASTPMAPIWALALADRRPQRLLYYSNLGPNRLIEIDQGRV